MVFKIAIHNAISETRSKKRQKRFSLEDFEKSNDYDSGLFVNIENSRYYLSPASTPDTDAENKELERNLDNSINNLKKIYKESFLLWKQGYTYNEISDILETPLGTVKSRVCRAKEKLKSDKYIKKHYEATNL